MGGFDSANKVFVADFWRRYEPATSKRLHGFRAIDAQGVNLLITQRLAHPGKLGAEGIAFGCEPAIDAARL